MRSIFVLTENGLSPTVCKNIYLNNVSYLDLEIYGEKILKKIGCTKKNIEEIMIALDNSKKSDNVFSLYDLVLHEMKYTTYKKLLEFDNPYDFLDLNYEEYHSVHGVSICVYNQIILSYDKLRKNNYNIPKCIETSDYLLYVLSNYVGFNGIVKNDLKSLMLNYTYPIENLESDLNELKQRKVVEENNQLIEYVYPRITALIEFKEDRNTDLVRKRLSGMKLQAIGDEYSLTRERVRQVIERYYEKLSRVYEDKYRLYFEHYDFSLEEFTYFFDEPESTYYYLSDKYNHGFTDFFEIDNDYLLDEEHLRRLKLLKNEQEIDGEYVSITRDGLIKYYLKKIGAEIRVEKLLEIITPVLEKYNIFGFENAHALEAVLERKKWCVLGGSKKYRYYETRLIDEDNLGELRSIISEEYGFFSTLFFFEKYGELMENMDIRDEYELHNILRNNLNLDNVIFLRMPSILIRYKTKEDFFSDKISELSPIQVNDFCKILRDEYGHKENTMSSYILSVYGKFITNGILKIQEERVNDNEIEVVKKALVKCIYSINELKELLNDIGLNNVSRFFSNSVMDKFGYKIIGKNVVEKKYGTIKNALLNAISLGQLESTFLIQNNSTAYLWLNRLVDERKIIKLNNKYYPYDVIYSAGISDDDIEMFKRYLLESVFSKEKYVTVKHIRSTSELTILNNTNGTDDMLISFALQIDGVISFKVNGIDVLTYNELSSEATRKRFVEHVIFSNRCDTRENLCNALLDGYGIKVDYKYLSNLLYSVFPSYVSTNHLYSLIN